MKWTVQQNLIIIILLNAFLFFVSCHNQFDNTNQNIDSSKSVKSTELSNIDTIIIKQGQILFTSNCSRCHAIFKTDNYLQGIVERVGTTYLKLYLTRQDSLIKAKDKYALKVKKAFGNLGNSHNFDFSDDQLNSIIAYLKKYSN